MTDPIRPVADTLRQIQGGQTLDLLGVTLAQVIDQVRARRKKGTVSLILHIEPLDGPAPLIDEPVFIRAEVIGKGPKAPAARDVFFIDADGNPTKTPQPRQQGLGLVVENRSNG